MFCVSFHHKNMETSKREGYSLNEEEQHLLLDTAKKSEDMDGIVMLMTCNRSEIYFDGNENGYSILEDFYRRYKGTPKEAFRHDSMRYEGRALLVHLYQVACGLDSAVIGEVEIIGQIKRAYQFSQEAEGTSGNLNIVFQNALNTAKEMASHSMMTKLPISVGTLVQWAALDFCKGKQEPHILVVGARGELGTIIRKDLSDANSDLKIVGTTRRHYDKAYYSGVTESDSDRMKWVHYDERFRYLSWADVIISATNSPHYTFLAHDVKKYLFEDGTKENTGKLFLDLAVPRDIDEEIGNLPNCQIKNMDYIKELAKGNNEQKLKEAQKIKLRIEERVSEIEKLLLFQQFWKENSGQMELLENKKASWLLFRLKEQLDYESFQKVLNTLRE